MSITIRQLAKALKTSPGTISKALSHEKGVSAERAEEICRYAKEHGYRPLPMRKRTTNTIGLIDCGFRGEEPIEDSYRTRLTTKILSCVSGAGFRSSVELLKHADDIPRLIQEHSSDGLILYGNPSVEICARIRADQIPSVVLDDRVERTGLPSIISDVSPGTRDVVEKLTAMGHRRIALVSTIDKSMPTVAARIRGYEEGLTAGQESMIRFAGNSSVQQGQIVTQQLMSLPKRPTAIIYLTDVLAVGGIFGLMKLGLSVPQDVSVVGHNNTELARQMDPSLSSVDLHLAEMVEIGLACLREQIHARALTQNPEQHVVPVTICWRNSTGAGPD